MVVFALYYIGLSDLPFVRNLSEHVCLYISFCLSPAILYSVLLAIF